MLLEILSLLIPSALAVKEATTCSTSTLENLQEAFQGESNACHRYAAFAKQADAEGYRQVASLFRAASKAEDFHARNHSDVIHKLGGHAVPKLETTIVKTTRENLIEARDGEIHERDQMYPPFIERAKKEKVPEAIRTFTYALKTEAEHARLFAAALQNLENMKTPMKYYVCIVCGYTVQTINFLKCLVCGHSKADYIPVE